ncbi:MAG: plectin, partial [Oscillospiraceae bacterium]|nr:plectin [Oscillospiraceae bacterium]
MSESRFMQTVLFGGYERSAVEERFESLSTQLFTLKNELRETKKLLSELQKGSDEAAALEEILSDERVRMAQIQAQNETVTKKIRAAEDDLAARDQEIEQLKAQIAELQDTLTQKTEKLTYLEANSGAEALSAVFIEAQKSADLLVSMAKKDAAALEANSKRLADNLVAEANNTAKKLIYDAEVRSTEMLSDSETRSEQLSAATENIKAYVL